MKSLTTFASAVLISGAIVLLALVLLFKPFSQALGSTARGGEYQSTTTNPTSWLADGVLLSTPGSIGNVIITGTQAGLINIYDATTSSVLLRAASMSSSSVLIASFPGSEATGTYPIDRAVVNGLLVNIVGTVPTTTITFRQ